MSMSEIHDRGVLDVSSPLISARGQRSERAQPPARFNHGTFSLHGATTMASARSCPAPLLLSENSFASHTKTTGRRIKGQEPNAPAPANAIWTQPWLSVVFVFHFRRSPQFVRQIIAFCEKVIDTALSFGNVPSDLKFPIHSHVVDGVEFHAIRIQFTWV